MITIDGVLKLRYFNKGVDGRRPLDIVAWGNALVDIHESVTIPRAKGPAIYLVLDSRIDLECRTVTLGRLS